MKKTILLYIFIILCNSIYSQDVVIIDTTLDVSNKEAFVILNGFGSSKKTIEIQKDFFKDRGYDLFIPDYITKKSIDTTVSNFLLFYEKNNLSSYKHVKVFCYIIGGYVLNQHIERYGKGNITTIIYDRSPTQERAPRAATESLPFISQLLYGKVLADFSALEITSLSDADNLNIGVIIESKATRLMRFLKKTADKYGDYNYNAEYIELNLDDVMYTHLDHNQMYRRFDIIGEEILHFMEEAVFTKNAKREQYNWDPFKKIKVNDIDL